jgi:hypothetical protein
MEVREDDVTPTELEQDLREIPDVRDVSVVGNGTLIATVVSGSFAGQNEAVRQATVWRLLRGRYDAEQLQNVEFVFTNAPGE